MSRLPAAVQVGILAVVVALAGIWFLAPQRQEMLGHSVRWYADLARDVGRAQDPAFVLLEPLTTGARYPLADFNGVAFQGCDLSMTGANLQLVTTWQGPFPQAELEARLTFVAGGQVLATDRWALAAARHDSAVPAGFFSGGTTREIQLMVVDAATGRPVTPGATFLPVVDSGVRICN